MNDTVYRQDAIAKLKERRKIFCKNRLDFIILPDKDKARVDEIDACIAALMNLPPVDPEPSQLAKDIARILENDQDMRVILKNAESEIVRCRDCKYRDENWRRVSVRWLPCMDVRTGSNWYCGSAERREDG